MRKILIFYPEIILIQIVYTVCTGNKFRNELIVIRTIARNIGYNNKTVNKLILGMNNDKKIKNKLNEQKLKLTTLSGFLERLKTKLDFVPV